MTGVDEGGGQAGLRSRSGGYDVTRLRHDFLYPDGRDGTVG